MEAVLERVTLKECDAACDPVEVISRGPRLVPSLDVDEVTFEVLDGEHAAVVVGFGVGLGPKDSDDLRCDLSASFRLVYRLGPLTPSERREFASTTAAHDAWPYWLDFLGTTLTKMGLPQLRLPASPPRRLDDNAREAFDVCLSMRSQRAAAGRPDIDALRMSLPRDELLVLDALWPVLFRFQEAKEASARARSAFDGTSGTEARLDKAETAVAHWQSRLDAVWQSADARLVGRLLQRLAADHGSPQATVELLRLSDAGLVRRLREASDRPSYEQAVAAVARAAKPLLGTGGREVVGPAGSPQFRAWITTPDRLAVDVDGEVWNAVPVDDETVLASKML